MAFRREGVILLLLLVSRTFCHYDRECQYDRAVETIFCEQTGDAAQNVCQHANATRLITAALGGTIDARACKNVNQVVFLVLCIKVLLSHPVENVTPDRCSSHVVSDLMFFFVM